MSALAPTPSQSNTAAWTGVWMLALVNAALLLLNLGRDSLWLDEMTSVSVVTGPLQQAVRFFRVFPEQHPLYYVLLKGWLLLGTSEFALRSLSAVFAVATTILIYFVGRESVGERVARIATVLSAFSPYLLYYGQEGRMYALLVFLALLSTFLFLRWVRHPTVALAAGYWLAGTAAVYTHLFAVFVIVAHVTWVLCSGEVRVRLRGALLLGVAIALAYLPWLLFTIENHRAVQDWKNWTHVIFGVPYTFVRWSVGYAVMLANAGWKERVPTLLVADAPILLIGAIAFGSAGLAGLRRLVPSWRQPAGLLLAVLMVPPLLALLASPAAILISERYLIVSYPAFVLLLAAGVVQVWDRSAARGRVLAGALCVTVLAALTRYYLDPRFGKAQWREVAAMITADRRDADAIILDAPMNKDLFRYYAGRLPGVATSNEAFVDSVRMAPRVWLVLSMAPDGGARILASLAATHAITADTLFPKDVGIRVVVLDRRL